MQEIMQRFRSEADSFGGNTVESYIDYSLGIDDLPKTDVVKLQLANGCSVVIRPSGTEPKLKVYISVTANEKTYAAKQEEQIVKSIEELL